MVTIERKEQKLKKPGTDTFTSMISKFLGATIFAVSGITACAGTNSYETITNSGPAVCDVQMSITLSNKVLFIGSNLVITAQIRNASTNVIYLHVSEKPTSDSHVSLIGISGTVHEFTPEESKHPVEAVFVNLFPSIAPGKAYIYEIPVGIDKTIKPGIYKFRVTRQFALHENGKMIPCSEGPLISNFLEVQIK